MKIWLLEHPGLEELALTEVFELLGVIDKCDGHVAEVKHLSIPINAKNHYNLITAFIDKGKILGAGIVEADVGLSDMVVLSCRGQSFKKILLAVDSNTDFKKIKVDSIDFKDYFSKDSTFKVEVEGVKGQDNRIEISKEISSHIFSLNKDKELKIDYKKAAVVFFVYFSGEKYFLGVDLTGFELNKRAYRVFPHQSSFKGDMSYYLVRKSGFKKGEKLGIGLVKDGVLAIEAALFNFGFMVNKSGFAWETLPQFKEVKIKENKKEKVTKKNIYGFDENMMNLRAAKKNAQIAGVFDLIELNRFGLDETDVKFKEGELDRMIFHVTKKDEDKLNEIYHQATYVLKKKGVLLMVGRNSWEISVPSKFKLISEEEVKRGESSWKVWVMEKK